MMMKWYLFWVAFTWKIKINTNPCAFNAPGNWKTFEIGNPSSTNPIVVLSPGIAFLQTHKFIKSIAGFYGPKSVIMSPYKGVYAWWNFPDQQGRAQSLHHNVNDLNFPGLFAQVSWLKSIIEANIFPSAIIAGSKGGFIVNDIWKYVWRGRTVIFNGGTAVVPNIVKDEIILPIFVISGRDEIFGDLRYAIAQKWLPHERGLIYWINQYHIPSYAPMVESIPSYLENGVTDGARKPVPHYSFRLSEMGNLMQAFSSAEEFKKYRPVGEICNPRN